MPHDASAHLRLVQLAEYRALAVADVNGDTIASGVRLLSDQLHVQRGGWGGGGVGGETRRVAVHTGNDTMSPKKKHTRCQWQQVPLAVGSGQWVTHQAIDVRGNACR